MRSLSLPTVLLLLLPACGDDEGVFDAPPPTIDAPVPVDAAPGPDATPAPDAEPGPDADTPDAAPGTPDATPNTAPVINRVSWMTIPACMPGVASNYTITIDATDAETPAALLTYSGTISGCGMVDMNPDTISCPNLAPYPGEIIVTDPGGLSDSLAIMISPCTNGMAP